LIHAVDSRGSFSRVTGVWREIRQLYPTKANATLLLGITGDGGEGDITVKKEENVARAKGWDLVESSAEPDIGT